jgi:Ser/Thr protein kinase RdoA (MazF antagonist)
MRETAIPLGQQALLQRVGALYNTNFTLMNEPQKGYRNTCYPVRLDDGRVANFILYKREPGIITTIKNANRIGDFLASAGMPTRQTLNDRIIHLQSRELSRYGALYAYLPGSTIPWEAYTRSHIKLLGKAMSDMHASLQVVPPTGLPMVQRQYQKIFQRLERYFSQPSVQQAMKRKLYLTVAPKAISASQQLLNHAHYFPAVQPLHMDFVRGNILFGTDATSQLAITGVLDFEKTAVGHPLFDIARTLAFLLVDCATIPEQNIRRYFLDSGYTKRGAATFRNIHIRTAKKDTNALEALINLFLLYDFYKFLRHNPYEYLGENHHFVRTRNLLIKRAIIVRLNDRMEKTGE